MIIAISGSSGFVGQNLKEYFDYNAIEAIEIALRDPNWQSAFKLFPTAVIHLAGKAHDTQNTSSLEEYYKVNRDLTIDVFNEFLHSSATDFFFFSSVKAVADKVDGLLKEDYTPSPQTAYGKSKLEAESYLLNQVLPSNKRLFIIRPCMIHGKNNKGNLNLLYHFIEKKLPWPLAAFDNQRSFLSVDNLSFLILQMLKNKNIKSGIYNFADDGFLSTNELIQLIGKSQHIKPKLWKTPKPIIHALGRLGDLLHLPLNSEKVKKLTESYMVSNEKIKNALDLSKLPMSIQDGIKKTLDSFSINNK
ncbi:MAG: NAD-dependent epimerase/dehydratase family protein [Saprospiraceae bacterium]|nr:NAD-dependent epimerase/dehydratase family protein [Saprospiraceae bacterium]